MDLSKLEKNYMTLKETAEYMGVTRPYISQLISANKIPTVMFKNVILILREDAKEWHLTRKRFYYA